MLLDLFKPIKSPVGEVVGEESYKDGVSYTHAAVARHNYWVYTKTMMDVGLDYEPFTDWLEAQGVRLV